jgi:hypothetical protein
MPHFSYDDKLIVFASGRDARRLMAQRLTSDMRPDGKPVAVFPSRQVKSSPVVSFDETSLAADLIVPTQAAAVGNMVAGTGEADAH